MWDEEKQETLGRMGYLGKEKGMYFWPKSRVLFL